MGWLENGQIHTDEVSRFPSGVVGQDGHLTWDIKALECHIRTGIDEALKLYLK